MIVVEFESPNEPVIVMALVFVAGMLLLAVDDAPLER